METLYKYRDLNNLEWIEEIIRKGELYAAKYKEFWENDGKEGTYNVETPVDPIFLKSIKYEKARIRICSFTQRGDNKYLWKKYADKHKGIVIGVEIIPSEIITQKSIIYGGQYILTEPSGMSEQEIAIKVLSHKREDFAKEEEERIFIINKDECEYEKEQYVDVKIKQIITGRKIRKAKYNHIKSLIAQYNPNIELCKEKPCCFLKTHS
jgi:hypothetical protein